MMQTFAGSGTIAMLAGIVGWLAAGVLIGSFHFLTLRRSAGMLAAGSSLPRALALHLFRFVVTAGALTAAARHGAMPLLAATLGLLGARMAVVRVSFGRFGSREHVAAAKTRSMSAAMRFASAADSSPPPCGEGMGWGVVQCGTAVPHRTTPHPIPPPQGGRESLGAAPSPISAPITKPATTPPKRAGAPR